MSAQLDFKPRIRRTDKHSTTLVVTAPNDVRSKLWNSLFPMDTIIRRFNAETTQFSLRPHEGYETRTVFVYSAVYLYTVMTDLSLEDFWALTPQQHLQALNEMIDLPEPVEQKPHGKAAETRPVPVFQPISKDELIEALTRRISHLAHNRIDKLLEGFRRITVNTDILSLQRSGLAAYRRLQFVDPNCTFISKKVWAERIRKCERNLEIMVEVHELALALNTQISALQEKGLDIWRQFDTDLELLRDGTLTLKEMLPKFLSAQEALIGIRTEIKAVTSSFSDSPADQALEVIKSITPVEG